MKDTAYIFKMAYKNKTNVICDTLMKDTAYIFKMAYKNKTNVIKWLKDRQNELLRAPLIKSRSELDYPKGFWEVAIFASKSKNIDFRRIF
jgi:hypothetical protein